MVTQGSSGQKPRRKGGFPIVRPETRSGTARRGYNGRGKGVPVPTDRPRDLVPSSHHPSPTREEDLMRTTSVAATLVVAGLTASGFSPCRAGEGGPAGTVAFSSLAPRGWDVYVADVESHKARRLTDHAALDFNAAFAPEGG